MSNVVPLPCAPRKPTLEDCEAAYQRVEAAMAAGDPAAEIEALDHLLDTYLAAGLITLDYVRALLLERQPGQHSMLTMAMIRLLELDPTLAERVYANAVDRMSSKDPSEAGWAALVAESYRTAKDEAGHYLVQLTPEQAAALAPLLRAWGLTV